MDLTQVEVTIHNHNVDISYGMFVNETIPYTDFKAFLTKMNALAAQYERTLRAAQPKDAA